MSEGFVYVLTNAAMPGYVKIGLTQQDDVADRVRQLDNTSTPLPFEVYYAAKVPDCRKLERTLHFVFGEKRARLNRVDRPRLVLVFDWFQEPLAIPRPPSATGC